MKSMPDSAHRRHFIISNAISLLPLVGFLYAGMVSLLYIAGYLLFVYWRLNTEYKYFQLFSDLKFPSALTRDLIYETALVHVLFLFSSVYLCSLVPLIVSICLSEITRLFPNNKICPHRLFYSWVARMSRGVDIFKLEHLAKDFHDRYGKDLFVRVMQLPNNQDPLHFFSRLKLVKSNTSLLIKMIEEGQLKINNEAITYFPSLKVALEKYLAGNDSPNHEKLAQIISSKHPNYIVKTINIDRKIASAVASFGENVEFPEKNSTLTKLNEIIPPKDIDKGLYSNDFIRMTVKLLNLHEKRLGTNDFTCSHNLLNKLKERESLLKGMKVADLNDYYELALHCYRLIKISLEQNTSQEPIICVTSEEIISWMSQYTGIKFGGGLYHALFNNQLLYQIYFELILYSTDQFATNNDGKLPNVSLEMSGYTLAPSLSPKNMNHLRSKSFDDLSVTLSGNSLVESVEIPGLFKKIISLFDADTQAQNRIIKKLGALYRKGLSQEGLRGCYKAFKKKKANDEPIAFEQFILDCNQKLPNKKVLDIICKFIEMCSSDLNTGSFGWDRDSQNKRKLSISDQIMKSHGSDDPDIQIIPPNNNCVYRHNEDVQENPRENMQRRGSVPDSPSSPRARQVLGNPF